MTRKPTTKSPEERRLRKQIRALIKFNTDTAGAKEDFVVREFLALIDDEVRRARMSMAPAVQYDDSSYKEERKHIEKSWKDWADESMAHSLAQLTCGGKDV